MGLIRTPRTRQPQAPVGLARANPLTFGLQATFSPAQGRMFDTHRLGISSPTADTGIQKAGTAGISRDYVAGQKSTFANSSRYGLASAMTIVAIFDVDALTNFGALLSCQDSATAGGWELRLGQVASDSTVLMHRANATAIKQFSTAANRFTAGSRNNFLAVTCEPLMETAPTVYANGAVFITGAAGGTGTGSPTASTSTLDIGARASGTTQLDGAVLFAALWNRMLSAAEVERVRRNPWQLFAPLPRRVWAPVAAGGNASVTLGSAAATSSAGAVTVSAGASVSAASAAATSGAGTVSAIPGVIVAISGASATSGAGIVSATGSASVAIAGAAATSSAGVVTVSASAVVTISGAGATSAAGTASATGAATTALSGAATTSSAGAITASAGAAVALSGAAATASAGTVTAAAGGSATATITGAAVASAAGMITVTAGSSITLASAAATGRAGNVSATNGTVVASSIRFDLSTGRIVKIINGSVTISF